MNKKEKEQVAMMYAHMHVLMGTFDASEEEFLLGKEAFQKKKLQKVWVILNDLMSY